MKDKKIKKIAMTGLMAALCYVAFAYLKIPIPVPGGDAVALHLGNVFCVLGALMLGGLYGGLAGSIGMTLADLMDPAYVTSAPKTFILKLCIGLIVGLVAHRIAHINKSTDAKYIFRWSLIATVAGFAFNVVMDPVVGYFYKKYILGIEASAASIMAKWAAGATFINAIVGAVVVMIVYTALRRPLKRTGLLDEQN